MMQPYLMSLILSEGYVEGLKLMMPLNEDGDLQVNSQFTQLA